jgi:rod shape-determining protein MreC
MDQRGMIGRVYLTGEHTSWVILLSDLNSKVPVSIEPNTDQAIMGGDNSPMPVIETMVRGVQLKADSQVVTSGDGDILPAGIPIGVIVPDGRRYRVALFADQTTAQDVQIVDYKQKPEKAPSVAGQELPATAAGLIPAAPQPQIATQQQVAPLPPPVFKPVVVPPKAPVKVVTPPIDDADIGNQ